MGGLLVKHILMESQKEKDAKEEDMQKAPMEKLKSSLVGLILYLMNIFIAYALAMIYSTHQ